MHNKEDVISGLIVGLIILLAVLAPIFTGILTHVPPSAQFLGFGSEADLSGWQIQGAFKLEGGILELRNIDIIMDDFSGNSVGTLWTLNDGTKPNAGIGGAAYDPANRRLQLSDGGGAGNAVLMFRAMSLSYVRWEQSLPEAQMVYAPYGPHYVHGQDLVFWWNASNENNYVGIRYETWRIGAGNSYGMLRVIKVEGGKEIGLASAEVEYFNGVVKAYITPTSVAVYFGDSLKLNYAGSIPRFGTYMGFWTRSDRTLGRLCWVDNVEIGVGRSSATGEFDVPSGKDVVTIMASYYSPSPSTVRAEGYRKLTGLWEPLGYVELSGAGVRELNANIGGYSKVKVTFATSDVLRLDSVSIEFSTAPKMALVSPRAGVVDNKVTVALSAEAIPPGVPVVGRLNELGITTQSVVGADGFVMLTFDTGRVGTYTLSVEYLGTWQEFKIQIVPSFALKFVGNTLQPLGTRPRFAIHAIDSGGNYVTLDSVDVVPSADIRFVATGIYEITAKEVAGRVGEVAFAVTAKSSRCEPPTVAVQIKIGIVERGLTIVHTFPSAVSVGDRMEVFIDVYDSYTRERTDADLRISVRTPTVNPVLSPQRVAVGSYLVTYRFEEEGTHIFEVALSKEGYAPVTETYYVNAAKGVIPGVPPYVSPVLLLVIFLFLSGIGFFVVRRVRKRR
jgi:hypothetical protein